MADRDFVIQALQGGQLDPRTAVMVIEALKHQAVQDAARMADQPPARISNVVGGPIDMSGLSPEEQIAKNIADGFYQREMPSPISPYAPGTPSLLFAPTPPYSKR